MVRYLGDRDRLEAGFVVRPNQAISRKVLTTVYVGIAAVALGIGLCFYIVGLTLILPFSGMEVVALGSALYLCGWRDGVQEVISISHDTITVESGRAGPTSKMEFPRAWATVVLKRSWNNWYPSQLLIRSHGRQVEIGRFLNEQERRGLARKISSALTTATR